MITAQIINQEAYELGKNITTTDRILIQNKLGVKENIVNVVLSGKRKAERGQSKDILDLARKIAKINQLKVDIL